MAGKEVKFNCIFTEGEIVVTIRALTMYMLSGDCPDALQPDLVSVLNSFQQVSKTGASLA